MDRRYLSFSEHAGSGRFIPNPGGFHRCARSDPAADSVESRFIAGANERLRGGCARPGRRLVRNFTGSTNTLGGRMGYDSTSGARRSCSARFLLRFRIGGFPGFEPANGRGNIPGRRAATRLPFVVAHERFIIASDRISPYIRPKRIFPDHHSRVGYISIVFNLNRRYTEPQVLEPSALVPTYGGANVVVSRLPLPGGEFWNWTFVDSWLEDERK